MSNDFSPSQSHKRTGVLEHTIGEITGTLERAFFAEEISTRKGLFQSLDARVKVISILALLISVSLSRSLVVISFIYVLVFIFAWASAIPASVLIKARLAGATILYRTDYFTGFIHYSRACPYTSASWPGDHADRRNHGTFPSITRQHISVFDFTADPYHTLEYRIKRLGRPARSGRIYFDPGYDLSLHIPITSHCERYVLITEKPCGRALEHSR